MRNYPVIKLAIAFITGILLSSFFPSNFYILTITSTLFFLLYIISLFYKKEINLYLSILIYAIVIQAGVYTAEVQNKSRLLLPEEIIKENVTLYGKIESIDLIKTKEVRFLVTTDSIRINNKIFLNTVKLICKFRSENKEQLTGLYNTLYPGYKICQRGIFNKGKVVRNPGEFDYNRYLINNGISGSVSSYHIDDVSIISDEEDFIKSYIFRIRKQIDSEITSLHSPETAALLRGLILADRSGIDYEVKESFINSGVMHILAVSGLHTGYIIIIFLVLFGRFNIILRSVLTAAGLIMFLIITGMPVSVVRAVIMAVIILLTFITDRSTNIYNSLAIAAMIILIADPSELYSPGFQLSFTAVLSIGTVYPLLKDYLSSRLSGSIIKKYLLLFMAVTLAAQIGTLPLTVYYFGKLSLISVLSNFVVIPLAGIIVCTAAVTLFLSAISSFLALIYASANDFFSIILYQIIQLTGDMFFSFIRINSFSITDILIFYFFILFSYIFFHKVQSLAAAAAAGTIILLNVILFTTLDNTEIMPEDKLTVLFIDVGQGDAALLKFPGGTTFLIDAGAASISFDSGERIIIPLLDHLNISRIDYAFISHLDTDHYGGIISLVDNRRIEHLYLPAMDYSDAGLRMEKYLRDIRQSFSYYHNEIIKLENSRIYSLTDEREVNSLSGNDRSGVLKIVYGRTSFLFTGDIHKAAEKHYCEKYGRFLESDVLKISHHGSNSSSSEEFINFVKQDFALISAGYKNRFNHPSHEVLRRLQSSGTRILRTDLQGGVLLGSDGLNITEIDWKKIINE